jgi:hypothetical protein
MKAKSIATEPVGPLSLNLGPLLGDFRLLLILFVSFRLVLLVVFQPLMINGIERGITAGGDFRTYFLIASLSDEGGLPLRDWWSEFPPLWSYLSVLVYKLTPNFTAFSMVLAALFLLADTGNLVIIRRIGAILHGEETGIALAWIYALLLAPLVFVFWTFESLVAFCLLSGIWLLIEKCDRWLPLPIIIGILLKFIPALMLGAVWRYRAYRQAFAQTMLVLGIVALVYLSFFVQNAGMTLPSLMAQFNKASYQTVWALIDGNYRTGNFGALTERFDPARAYVLQGNPPRVPGWLRLGLALAIGLLVFFRTRRFDHTGLVAFAGIALLLFFLQSQGWSPQWLVQLIPLVLLCFPTRTGVLVIVVITLASFFEYPLLFSGFPAGEITSPLITPFALSILARTGIFIGLSIAFYNILRQPVEIGGKV